MATTIKHNVEIRLVCDRCGLSFTTTEVGVEKRQGWLSLHTGEIIPDERFDLCPKCSQEFREGFLNLSPEV